MAAEPKHILAIDPGSTSTKFALYADEKPLLVRILRHSEETMQPFKGKPLIDQCNFRRGAIRAEIEKEGFRLAGLAAAVGRGGLLKPLASGTYRVTQKMLDDLLAAERGEHASNLGAFLAKQLADDANAPAFVVDPVSVDEWPPRARLSGSAELPRQCLSHALNTKAVAKRFAREQRRRYEDLRLIVAHLGSGISVSAHDHGRMVDVTNSREEGPFSTERAGTVPAMMLVDLCFSGKHTRKEVENLLFREGGLYSYLRTKDLVEVGKRIAAGDDKSALVWEAMVYQVVKEIGSMAAALQGHVDAVLLTGGMAHSERLVNSLRASVEWIAPVEVCPGEDELQALAEGALRVLRGEESAREY
ncbi:MAG: butyrate kinase [Terriglobia bacterium]